MAGHEEEVLDETGSKAIIIADLASDHLSSLEHYVL